jgi:AbrB family looped-hinge helix DNA binding protein
MPYTDKTKRIMPLTNGITHFIMPFMTTRITIDAAGRVVLPKPLRTKLDLSPGDSLELESSGESITLRPVRNSSPLTREKGVWVYRTGRPLSADTVDEVLNKAREQRDGQNLGEIQ